MHQQRYLWLLKRALVDALNAENELRLAVLQSPTLPAPGLERERFLRDVRWRLPNEFADLEAARRIGRFRCSRHPLKLAHTTIGLSGLDNLERCAEIVFRERVDGDFLEAGVLAGGAAIFMRGLQRACGESHRSVWVADSFRGLPPSTAEPDVAAGLDLTEPHVPWLCRTVEAVRENFRRHDLLDDGVRFVEGWLAESLPRAPISRLAVLRIDVDLYQSTLDVLQLLYGNVSAGGFVIVDDYGLLRPCQQAVDEFRSSLNISSPLLRVDQQRVFWRKDT
jgi:O-methyltransferase